MNNTMHEESDHPSNGNTRIDAMPTKTDTLPWIETYLAEVGRYLAVATRTDILCELRSTLEEQAHELAGGDAVSDEHQKQVINQMGHPMKVASDFNGPRSLIGPALFPIFVQTWRIVMVIVAIIQCAVLLYAYTTSGWTIGVEGLIKGVLETLLWSTGIVVAVFAAIEASGATAWRTDNWTADRLSKRRGHIIDYSDLITNLVSEAVFLLWWNGALPLTDWLPDEILVIDFGPALSMLYWPLNILFGAWLLLHTTVMIRGLWQRTTLIFEIVLGSIGVATGLWLLSQAPLLNISGHLQALNGPILQRVLVTVVVVICAFTAWDVILASRRLRRGAPGRTA